MPFQHKHCGFGYCTQNLCPRFCDAQWQEPDNRRKKARTPLKPTRYRFRRPLCSRVLRKAGQLPKS